MKDLQPTRGKRLLRSMIAEGEHEQQDFKFAISDARKIARSISAFANNSGGRLLIGVKDNGVVAGVRNEEDIYVVEQAAERYCRPAQSIEFKAYTFEGDVRVIVATIEAAVDRPVYASEPDGTWKAYYRVADENITAHPLMVRGWEMEASPLSSSFSLDGIHTRLLDYLASCTATVDSREVAVALHISQTSSEDAVAHLASMNLIEFVFDGVRFKFRRKE